ncbi:MAG: adenosine deaminase [Propionibacteriaceae bacterium]|nr:adenosine deaminase [Propionibacteriaceae bacterium]
MAAIPRIDPKLSINADVARLGAASAGRGEHRRDVSVLPKAHLHLHFTGSLDVPTMVALAQNAHVKLPEQLTEGVPFSTSATTKGWFRFQRFYDIARRAVTGEAALRAVINNAARLDAADGARRLEIQIDPTSYAASVGGIINALDIVLDEAAQATKRTGVEVAVIVAASRLRHPIEARTLARLAARHAGTGPGQVVGFGLSNDEWAGDTATWEGAFRIARNAGLPGVPHGGELRGPDHVRAVLAALHPARLGHGVRASEDPALMDQIIQAGVAFEVCPASNVQLGVYQTLADVPLRRLVQAGATVALGADDPLLFRARLADQYRIARELGFDDFELAELARSSIRASFADAESKDVWLAEVDAWLAG